MGIEVTGIGGLIILALNIWAIVSVIGSGATTGKKVLWTLAILILPILGFILWLLLGPRANRSAV
ncbi:MAG: PLD nuclease N-terminal domain-containing protein [Pseudomonadota bacterium]